MAIVGLSGPAPEPALGESPGALATVARVAFAAAFAALRSRFGARCRFRPFEDPAHTRLNRLIDVEDEMTCTGFRLLRSSEVPPCRKCKTYWGVGFRV